MKLLLTVSAFLTPSLASIVIVEWMAKKLIPPMPDLEERACETFQWDIKDWRALDKRVTGPEFEIGGYKWQVVWLRYIFY